MKNRRDFLRSAVAAQLAIAGSPMLGLFSSAAARAADTDGYKALVCIFLYGGLDCHDTILPYDPQSYNNYAQIRSSLLSAYATQPGGSTRTRDKLLPVTPSMANFGSRQFALPPQLSGLHQLFNDGSAAIVGNVGPLHEPTDRAAFESKASGLPPRLFSHNDQQSTWMSFAPEGAQLGWGGRFGDAVAAASNTKERIFSQISLAGHAVFLAGELVAPYQIGAGGVPSIFLVDSAQGQLASGAHDLVRNHFAAEGAVSNNLFERDFINLSRVSMDANDQLDEALQSGASLSTSFPASALGGQLRAVAQTMAVRETLGVSRQVFFVGLGGFDTHSAQAADLPALQQDIGDSVAAFYTATQELGIADEVTTFTAADFGRTLTVNGDGTDHGWGAHHFVVGGAVRGGDIYGDIPVSELGHEQDAGNGRLIPTTSVEQYAAPLGRWFGLSPAELEIALPGLANFPAGALDFI